MINKDPGKKHFLYSMVKSGFRIAGCILALTLPANFGMWLFVWAFLIAEGIGIAEEF
jgi:hypothetical protein|tara:strand:+ start:9302 stop:9472 length:171 start_codon:yes stop_codon:yes gene_type:complete